MTDYIFCGLLYSLVLAVLIFCIFLSKKLFSRKLTSRAHYYIWLTLPFSGVALFFPEIPRLQQVSRFGAPDTQTAASASGSSLWNSASSIQDFAVSSQTELSQTFCAVLAVLWLAGVLFMLLRMGAALYRTRSLCQRAVDAEMVPEVSAACRIASDRLNLKKTIRVRLSSDVKSPVTVGIFHPCVLLPAECRGGLSYIFLHEFVHCRYRDPLLNVLMQLFLSLNWMNPAVWYALHQFESDREACCDSFVLDILCRRERTEYGRAILSWAEGGVFPAVGFVGGKHQLRRRIRQIAGYRPSTALCRKGSAALLILMTLLTFTLVPSVHGLTGGQYHPSEDLNISAENLSSYFEGQDGSFVLYHPAEDQYTIYNQSAAADRVSPNSTYKIYSALAALESGTITAKQSFRKWDGTSYAFSQWNRGQDLKSAMRNSVNWYFQGLDQQTGRNALQTFYERINYGNENLNGGISSYWMESSLKISPLEQTMLLTDFYFNRWSFSETPIAAVKDALLLSDENGIRLSGKTGTGMKEGCSVNGWFIGYVESDDDLYIFSLNLRGEDGASGSRAAETALRILRDKQIL